LSILMKGQKHRGNRFEIIHYAEPCTGKAISCKGK
jgi:hypothetical protein